MTDETKKIKITFVGDEAVGKTSIILRIQQNGFDEKLGKSAGGTNHFINLKFNHDNSVETIEIINFDLAGDKKYREERSFNYAIEDASAVAVVFDPSSLYFSIVDLENWLKLIKQKAPGVIIALVKNKSDLPEYREFSEDSIKELLNKYDAMYFITSAKKNEGIIELYEGLINKITGLNGNLELIKENQNEKTESINIGNGNKEKMEKPKKRCDCCG